MNFMKLTSLYLAASLAFIFANAFPSLTHAAEKKIEIKIGSVTIKDTVHQWMLNFKANVERRVGNRVDVRVFPAGQLGGIPREIEGVQLGTQQIVLLPPDFFVGINKGFMVTSAPGLFRDLRHAQNSIHDPAFKSKFFKLGNDKGIQPFGIFCGDLAHYVSRRPIKKLNDFKNKKIRVFASPMERLTMRKLGASPAPIPLMQALQALQRGTIDGMKSGFSIFTSFKYWSVTKHLTRTTESTIAVMAVTNPAFMAKLPADIRQIITEEAQHTDWETLAFAEDFLKTNQGKWEKNGGTVYDLSKEDRAELTKRLQSVGDEVVSDLPAVKELFGILKTAAAKY
jgi:TRAP-type C4-dicarboxylate transport system substrate-binding protein